MPTLRAILSLLFKFDPFSDFSLMETSIVISVALFLFFAFYQITWRIIFYSRFNEYVTHAKNAAYSFASSLAIGWLIAYFGSPLLSVVPFLGIAWAMLCTILALFMIGVTFLGILIYLIVTR